MINECITDGSLLAGHTANQLKHMLEILNRGYPHLKLPKHGNKTELVDRVVAANMLIAALKPSAQREEPPAQPSALLSLQSAPATTTQSISSSSRPEPVEMPAAKRAKPGEKTTLLALIAQYNVSQVAAYDASSKTKVNKLALTGSCQLLRERLVKVGVKVPDF